MPGDTSSPNEEWALSAEEPQGYAIEGLEQLLPELKVRTSTLQRAGPQHHTGCLGVAFRQRGHGGAL